VTTLYYLAYGSNLHPLRLRKRVGWVRPVGPVRVEGYGLDFHKRGFRDGSGKCTLTPDARRSAWGVIYALDERRRPDLDRHEGLGMGYDTLELMLQRGGRSYACFSYLATPDARDPDLLPFDWYRELVLAGAQHYAFPEGYIEEILATPVTRDGNRERIAENRGLLEEMLEYPGYLEEL